MTFTQKLVKQIADLNFYCVGAYSEDISTWDYYTNTSLDDVYVTYDKVAQIATLAGFIKKNRRVWINESEGVEMHIRTPRTDFTNHLHSMSVSFKLLEGK